LVREKLITKQIFRSVVSPLAFLNPLLLSPYINIDRIVVVLHLHSLSVQGLLVYILAILFRPFGFIAPKTLNYWAFQSVDFEYTWWRLLQKRVVRTRVDIYVIPDKGYSRNASCALKWISTLYLMKVTPETRRAH